MDFFDKLTERFAENAGKVKNHIEQFMQNLSDKADRKALENAIKWDIVQLNADDGLCFDANQAIEKIADIMAGPGPELGGTPAEDSLRHILKHHENMGFDEFCFTRLNLQPLLNKMADMVVENKPCRMLQMKQLVKDIIEYDATDLTKLDLSYLRSVSHLMQQGSNDESNTISRFADWLVEQGAPEANPVNANENNAQSQAHKKYGRGGSK